MPRRTQRRVAPRLAHRGFTLVELLILVTAALVVAGLAVPVLRGIRLASNSESALQTLASLRDAEIAHKERGRSKNAAGANRFARFDELVAAEGKVPVGLEESVLVDDGRRLQRHGYLFAIYFVTRDNKLVDDPAGATVLDGKQSFVLYAWPHTLGASGSSVFALDPSGALFTPAAPGALESKNLLLGYSGLRNPPRADAALKTGPGNNAVTFRGADGDLWELVSILAPG